MLTKQNICNLCHFFLIDHLGSAGNTAGGNGTVSYNEELKATGSTAPTSQRGKQLFPLCPAVRRLMSCATANQITFAPRMREKCKFLSDFIIKRRRHFSFRYLQQPQGFTKPSRADAEFSVTARAREALGVRSVSSRNCCNSRVHRC